MLHQISNKRIIYRNWYLFVFDTKMTISPTCSEARFAQARCLCLSDRQIPSYTYPRPKPKESLNFLCLVTLRVLFFWSFPPCLVTTSWERKQEIQRSPPEGAQEGDWTSDKRIKSGLLCVRKSTNVQANAICPKISFLKIGFGIYYFSKISHSAHSAHCPIAVWRYMLEFP